MKNSGSCARSASIAVTLTLLLFGFLSGGPSRAAESPDVKPSPEWTAIAKVLPDSVQVSSQLVYVDFWASWCPPCRKSFPWMSAMQSSFDADELTIIAVSLDRPASKGIKFVKESGATFPVIYDPKGDLAKQFEIGAMPTSFLFDGSRHIVAKHTGFSKKAGNKMESEWRALLKQDKPNAEGKAKP